MRIWVPAAVLCLGLVTACHCSTSGALGARAAAPDTVRGLVVVAGASSSVVLLRAAGSAELILLQGPADGPLRSLESMEIFATGTMRKGPRGRTLTGVRDFGVIADSRQPTRDGRLVKTGDLLTIVSGSGIATAVAQPSAELRRHVGERVWLAGVPDAPPTAFGVIPDLPFEPGQAYLCSPSRIERGGHK